MNLKILGKRNLFLFTLFIFLLLVIFLVRSEEYPCEKVGARCSLTGCESSEVEIYFSDKIYEHTPGWNGCYLGDGKLRACCAVSGAYCGDKPYPDYGPYPRQIAGSYEMECLTSCEKLADGFGYQCNKYKREEPASAYAPVSYKLAPCPGGYADKGQTYDCAKCCVSGEVVTPTPIVTENKCNNELNYDIKFCNTVFSSFPPSYGCCGSECCTDVVVPDIMCSNAVSKIYDLHTLGCDSIQIPYDLSYTNCEENTLKIKKWDGITCPPPPPICTTTTDPDTSEEVEECEDQLPVDCPAWVDVAGQTINTEQGYIEATVSEPGIYAILEPSDCVPDEPVVVTGCTYKSKVEPVPAYVGEINFKVCLE